jgi:hypothetical protein
MSDSDRIHCAAMLAVVFFLTSVAAGQEKHRFAVGGGLSSHLTGSLTVSHGHAYFVEDEPGILFGGIQDEAGQWKLNYLVLVKQRGKPTSTIEHGNPDPAVSSDSSDGIERRLNFKERLRIDESVLDFSYRARIDLRTNLLTNEQFSVNEKPMQVKKGRVIIVDMTAAPIHVQQLDAELPSSQGMDFIDSSREQYDAVTKRWMTELTKESEILAKAFLPSEAAANGPAK